MLFSESDRNHLKWLRLKAFQARERLEAADKEGNGQQSEALLDLIDALGDGCVRTILAIVREHYNFDTDTHVAREVRAMAKDIVDVAWDVDEAVEMIEEYILSEK